MPTSGHGSQIQAGIRGEYMESTETRPTGQVDLQGDNVEKA